MPHVQSVPGGSQKNNMPLKRISNTIKTLRFTQLNCHKSPHVTRALSIEAKKSDILLLCETPLVQNHPRYLGTNFVPFAKQNPSAVIAVNTAHTNSTLLMGNLSNDFTSTVMVNTDNSTLYLTCIYLNPSSTPQVLESELNFLDNLLFSLSGKKHLLAGDFNAWNKVWGSKKNNKRGSMLYELFASHIGVIFWKMKQKKLTGTVIYVPIRVYRTRN